MGSFHFHLLQISMFMHFKSQAEHLLKKLSLFAFRSRDFHHQLSSVGKTINTRDPAKSLAHDADWGEGLGHVYSHLRRNVTIHYNGATYVLEFAIKSIFRPK